MRVQICVFHGDGGVRDGCGGLERLLARGAVLSAYIKEGTAHHLGTLDALGRLQFRER